MHVPSQPRNVPGIGAPCRVRGFSLVELMVTVVVAAILLMIAVPSLTSIVNSNRLTTAANAMVNTLNTARMEAIKLNATTQWCSSAPYQNTDSTGSTADSALSTACGTSAGAVVELTGSTANLLLAAPPELTSPVQLSGYNSGIRFNGQGVGYWAEDSTKTPLTSNIAVLCVAGLSGNNVISISMATGTIVTTTPSAGICR